MFKFWKNFFLYEISITNTASISLYTLVGITAINYSRKNTIIWVISSTIIIYFTISYLPENLDGWMDGLKDCLRAVGLKNGRWWKSLKWKICICLTKLFSRLEIWIRLPTDIFVFVVLVMLFQSNMQAE